MIDEKDIILDTIQIHACKTRDKYLSNQHPIYIDVVGIGAGIHNIIALTEINKTKPNVSIVLIDESRHIGGVFARLRGDYDLKTTFRNSCNTSDDVCTYLEKLVHDSTIDLLLESKVNGIFHNLNNKNYPYSIQTDIGIIIYTRIVLVGTGYEYFNDYQFDEDTKSIIQNNSNTIQCVDRFMWNIGRMSRYHNHNFQLNAKNIAIIGGGCSSEYAMHEILRVNKYPSTNLFWIQGSTHHDLAVYSRTTIINPIQGYANKITTKQNGSYQIHMNTSHGCGFIDDIDFIVIATGYRRILYHSLLKSLNGIAKEHSQYNVNQLETIYGMEDIYFVGTTIQWSDVETIMPNTEKVIEFVLGRLAMIL